MKPLFRTYYAWGLSLALCVAAFLFWCLRFPQALVYQEQIQLFLFDAEYFADCAKVPAGVARWLAELLVQFYNNVLAGAAIIAGLYVLLQGLVWRLMRRENASLVGYPLSFVPSLLVWLYMGDENMKLTFVVALLLGVGTMLAYPRRWSIGGRIGYLAVVMPLLHGVAGPVVLMLGLYVMVWEAWVSKRYLLAVGGAVYAVASVLVFAPLVPYPLYRLFFGIGYSLVVDDVAMLQYIIMGVCALLPLAVRGVPSVEGSKARVVALTEALVLAVVGVFGIPTSFDASKYEVLDYDYMVRAQRWDAIIAKAERKSPDSPLTVASLNLALGMKGQLNERAMQFYQNGWQGAFPVFNKNFESSLMTAEIYYHLGLVNTAQRFCFEAMEAIPDNNKSARIVKRLAETNLINGQYEVARKYLLLLEKTLFYRKWAQETMALLGDETAIDRHPVYGQMRRFRLTEDFLFSEQEVDKIMGKLVMRNADNYLAIQYLLLLPQLEGNQQKYMIYRDFVRKTLEERQKGGEKHE